MHALIRAVCTFALALAVLAVPFKASAEDEKQRFRPWSQLRIQNVVLQRLDFSCGAASVATVSTYFLGKPMTEEQALRLIRARYSDAEWKQKQKLGLSMDDMAFMAEQFGFSAQGGKIGLAGLLQVQGPLIVHLDKGGFQHFTVLRGIHGMTVYLADPMTGSSPMPLGHFIEQFTGTVLAIWDPKKPIPSDYAMKLRNRDAYHDNVSNVVRRSFYDRVRPLGPSF